MLAQAKPISVMRTLNKYSSLIGDADDEFVKILGTPSEPDAMRVLEGDCDGTQPSGPADISP